MHELIKNNKQESNDKISIKNTGKNLYLVKDLNKKDYFSNITKTVL